jgi:hypothetical protein
VADDLDHAVKAARFAMLDPGWPVPVKRAFTEWVTHMDDVAKAVAAQDGVEPGARLSGKDRQAYTQRAFTAVMDG